MKIEELLKRCHEKYSLRPTGYAGLPDPPDKPITWRKTMCFLDCSQRGIAVAWELLIELHRHLDDPDRRAQLEQLITQLHGLHETIQYEHLRPLQQQPVPEDERDDCEDLRMLLACISESFKYEAEHL